MWRLRVQLHSGNCAGDERPREWKTGSGNICFTSRQKICIMRSILYIEKNRFVEIHRKKEKVQKRKGSVEYRGR